MIDPGITSDLLIVKQAFEDGALQKEGNAVYLPFREMVQKARQTHQTIRKNAARYPSNYIRDRAKNKGLLDKIQNECIPCSKRLNGLFQLDMKPEIFSALNMYNQRALQSVLNFYKQLKGTTPIERNLCEIYAALKSQCIPDLTRLVAALTFLLQDIRSLDLKALKNSFLNVLGSIMGKIVAGFAMGLDRYARLITDVLSCMLEDIKGQLGKLNPILTPEGRDQLQNNWKKAWSKQETDKNWLGRNVQYTPVYDASKASQTITKAQGKLQDVGQKTSQLPQIPFDIGGGDMLEGILNMATGRVEVNLEGAIHELLKLLKANSDNMDQMNTYMFQLQGVVGLVALVKALVSSGSQKGLSDPCGPDRGRQFIQRLRLPNRRIVIQHNPFDPPGNPEIVIIPDPPVVDNPVVRDILIANGIDVQEVPVDTNTPGTPVSSESKRLQLIVPSEPITIHFLECMGKGVQG